MGETPLHVKNIAYTLIALEAFFKDDPMVFVAGNMFVYYVPGNQHRHVSPDIFMVRGIPKVTTPPRECYLVWENKPIDFVLEMTSDSTREQDVKHKMSIYQDTLRIPEYFLFDPHEEYLHPPLQGYRLVGNHYAQIAAVNGRLPSQVLDLHLEYRDGIVRLYNPTTGAWLPTPPEETLARQQAERDKEAAERGRKAADEARKTAEEGRKTAEEGRKTAEGARETAEEARRTAEEARKTAEESRKAAEEENQRLRRELEELRRRAAQTEQKPEPPPQGT
jgi:Uma2 family endonuclease